MKAIGPFMDKIAAARQQWLDQEDSAVEDVLDQGASEFERFEDLTRKLVQVPKSEIDEQRKD
jgi:hypothetical protein